VIIPIPSGWLPAQGRATKEGEDRHHQQSRTCRDRGHRERDITHTRRPALYLWATRIPGCGMVDAHGCGLFDGCHDITSDDVLAGMPNGP
jgi:hypothetical protein